MPKTPRHVQVETELRRDLEQYVRVRLAEGLSWRAICNDVRRDTGINVSHESLRSWFTEDAA